MCKEPPYQTWHPIRSQCLRDRKFGESQSDLVLSERNGVQWNRCKLKIFIMKHGAKVIYKGCKFLMRKKRGSKLIMQLYLTKRLLWTEFSDVAIPIVHTIRQSMGNIVFQELLKFETFINLTKFTNLSMQMCKDGEVFPVVKECANMSVQHLFSLSTCMPHAGGEGFHSYVRIILFSLTRKILKTQFSKFMFHGVAVVNRIGLAGFLISEDTTLSFHYELSPCCGVWDHLLS